MNVTQMISPIPDFTDLTNLNNVNISSDMVNFWMQLGALSVATQNLFLGHAVYVGPSPGKIGPGPTVIPGVTGRFPNSWVETNLPGFPSFLDIPDQVDESPIFVWGDVLKGIEEMSHNVTAALLTLQLGTMDSTCLFDQLNVQIYQYSSLDLWAPYGVSN
jgi:hypothetical protein